MKLYAIEQQNIYAYKHALQLMGGKTELLIGDRIEGLIKVSQSHSDILLKRIIVLGGKLPNTPSGLEKLITIELENINDPNNLNKLTDNLLNRFREIIPLISKTINLLKDTDLLSFSALIPILDFYVTHEDELEAFSE
ncbi:hypothetical protein KMW28_24115 [Flammeovirga yaeyamensis]|uniref:Uncharacterized protein n=1 Tax=Flammeovirga yaeyamensis TaxID=367791 RepID=A0AAX1NFQ7_9BACT|nr:hypothetical protein [Flammeovirga yaeyamensis]MBB3696532.1 hypothetical protein [Flammeovirga yaeyamensis]NMF33212.1 hypothetical protein [Flammeovirga yaeyamensis]QWG05508.1 hypothetical protein KMW28_24115 [Flammeovirga yaeyamensis]